MSKVKRPRKNYWRLVERGKTAGRICEVMERKESKEAMERQGE